MIALNRNYIVTEGTFVMAEMCLELGSDCGYLLETLLDNVALVSGILFLHEPHIAMNLLMLNTLTSNPQSGNLPSNP